MAAARKAHSYRQAAAACLCLSRQWRPLAVAALLAAALPLGGCSFSYKLDGLFSKDDKGPAQTAAVTTVAASEPSDADLAIAKQTATELLSKGGKDLSLPWENPRTGARGTVTALAQAYTQDGFTCHNFLASRVQGEKESWFQGDACRIHGGRWQVRDIKPLQRT